MSKDIVTGIDIGTSTVKVCTGRVETDRLHKSRLQIVGIGEEKSQGVRRGMIYDVEDVISSLSMAVEKAEKMAGVPIESSFISVGGSVIDVATGKGVVAISRADGEVTEEDVERVIESASSLSIIPNKEIIHVIPRSFTIDNQKDIRDPVGMQGIRLEADVLMVSADISSVKNLSKCIHRLGIEIDDFVLAPLATSAALLDKNQKDLGVAVINIGAGSTDLSVFEDGELIHASVIPVGSNHITNDLAIGLRTTIPTAEKVKILFGYQNPKKIDRKEKFVLDSVHLSELKENISQVSKKYVAEIIDARTREIFDFVDNELAKVDRKRKLPGGAVLSGGGAHLRSIMDAARDSLLLPCNIGKIETVDRSVMDIDDSIYSNVIGLLAWEQNFEKRSFSLHNFRSAKELSHTISRVKGWLKNFLP